MSIKESATYICDIYVSGEPIVITQTVREFCSRVGLCVSLMPVSYIYTGGDCQGIKLTLINYPKFPRCERDILEITFELSEKLLSATYTRSLTLVAGAKSYYMENTNATP